MMTKGEEGMLKEEDEGGGERGVNGEGRRG